MTTVDRELKEKNRFEPWWQVPIHCLRQWNERAATEICYVGLGLLGWHWKQKHMIKEKMMEVNLVILLYCLYASTFPYFLSADSCSQKVLSEDVILKRIGKWNQKASEEAKPQAMVCHWQKEATMWERLVRRLQAILHLPVQVWKPQKPPTIEKSDIKNSSNVFIIYPNWHQMKLCILKLDEQSIYIILIFVNDVFFFSMWKMHEASISPSWWKFMY